jgi:hypothetical protein
MGSSTQQASGGVDWIAVIAGLGIALVGLKVIDSINPRLSPWYIAVIILGVVLVQKTGFQQFTTWLLTLTSQPGVIHSH